MPSQKQLQNLRNFVKLSFPICLEQNYPILVLCSQWVLESGWGEKISGDNNYFGMTYTKGKKARKQIGSTGFSWVPTHEELTIEQIKNLDNEEKLSISSQTVIPGTNKFLISLKRRFTNYESYEASIQDQIELIKFHIPYSKYYDWWTKNQNNDRDRELLQQIAGTYGTATKYAKTVNDIYTQLHKLIGNLMPSLEPTQLTNDILPREINLPVKRVG